MNFKLRSTILGWLCIFIATWVNAAPPSPALNTSKIKYGLLEKIPASIARFFPAALPKPSKAQASIVANTVQWTGAISTDWNTAGNWMTVSGTPNLPPKKGSITGDHVIIPDVSGGSGNFPVITIDSARARSITLQAGASLTINSGGKLEVVGSDSDGFTNEGVFTNKGTILVDSAYNDAFINKLNAQIINQGQLTLQNGFGNRLLNYGSITNTSGNFSVSYGVDTAFINYPTGSVTNNATFSVSGGENVRLYNLGIIENNAGSFTIDGASLGIGFTNGKNASFINQASVTIQGGVDAQLINDGSIENRAGTFLINGSSFLDYVAYNRNRIVNKTGATFTISSGNGSRLINDSIVINDGTFTLNSGGNDGTKPSLYNGVNDTIRNTGTLTVNAGAFTTLLNCGVLQNLGTVTLGAGAYDAADKGITLHNKAKIINETGARINFVTGTNYGILNDSVIINKGTIKCEGGGGRPSLKNSVGDTIISQGEILIQYVGGGADLNNLGDAGFVNAGYFEFYDKLTVQYLGINAILNSGVFLGKPGSTMSLHYGGSTSPLFYNEPGGQVTLEGTTSFGSNYGGAILNYGRFKQLGGKIENLSALGKAVFKNYNYMEIRDLSTFKAEYLDTLFINIDSLIIGAITIVEVSSITHFMTNLGYCLNQANFRLQRSSSNGISNEGTFVNEAEIIAYYMSSNKPFIDNKSNAKFFQKGKISIFTTDGSLIKNAGYFANSGTFKVSNVNGYGDNSAIVNSDTLINEGIIEMDTLGNNGIYNSKYFRNSRNGEIYADFVRNNGIYNTGDVYNFGQIWMARDTGIGKAGICNNKLFDNCGVINIGAKGPVFGGGIVNTGSGVFNNRPYSKIVIDHVDSLSIKNAGTSFSNGLCASIEVASPIQDSSNTFSNQGTIVQLVDTLALDSDINLNGGVIYDTDPENFIVTTNEGQIINAAPDGEIRDSISIVSLDTEICQGDTARFIVTASCPAGIFDLVISGNGVDHLIESYVSGDTLAIPNVSADSTLFIVKSINVDGLGQVEKDIPGVTVKAIDCNPIEINISDPCTCVNNAPIVDNGSTTNEGTFGETVTVNGPTGQIWTIVSVSGLYIDSIANIAYAIGDTIPETGAGVYELHGFHRDSAGYTIRVTNSQGATLSIGNTCYYPDPVFTGLPALVSPNAAPFTVTGTVANNAAGTGTFLLDDNTQAGAGAAPTKLKINPASLTPGTHTLVYSFDAGAPGSKDSLDPGCIQQVRQRFQIANCGCQNVTVTLDANCQFVLTSNLVSDGNCNAGTVRVMDNNPSNGDIIDCAGVWTYGLFDSFGNILCWGKVTAEDKTAPAVVCTDFFNGTLDCFDVNYVLNNNKTIGSVLDNDGDPQTASPKPSPTGAQTINNAEGVAGEDDDECNLNAPGLVADDIYNLGYPYFKDNCRTCGCRVTLKWSDKVVFYGCDSIAANGIYARIYREWVATDCNGTRSSIIQVIPFARPDVVLDNGCGIDAPFSDDNLKFRGAGSCGEDAEVPAPGYDWVVQYTSCTPDKSLIKKIDVTPSFRSYFWNSKTKRDIYIDEVECNYSVSIKDTEFPICNGKGVKIDRAMYIFDWCAGGIIDTIHILIKIGDFTPPKLEYAHHAPFVISTGPMDCTAAFPVTVSGIKSAFGVSITDNCAVANATVTVKTKDRYVKGILVAENTWDKVDYAIMNGTMIGVPVGTHRMIIDAFDGCYNAKRDSFDFEVQDKIAPVMKCDDKLNISLSNGNGYTTGYAQATADELDEGSWDNCKLAWIAVRRNVPTGCEASFIGKGYDTNGNGKLDPLPADGDWTKADGFDRNGDGDLADFGETFILKGGKLMTPLQDNVEFFCCDLTALVTVELWGADSYGNTNFCWDELLIEDKVAPYCVAPWPLTVDCDEKCLEKIDDKKTSTLCFGDVTITSGNDCAALDTVYTVEKKLKCGYGTIVRKWSLTKQTVKGPITINCSQTITVLPRHEYNICFPKDAIADCKTPIVDTVITDELGCDILAVNVLDKRYDASDDECYKIFRTYTVINWCTFSDECADASDLGGGDPNNSYGFVVDRGTFGNYGKKPLYVLVRDEDLEDNNGEIYVSKDLIVSDDDEASDFDHELYYCQETEDYYQVFQYTQIIKVYDDTRPVVTGAPGKFCIREGADCKANLNMVINGKDNCSDKVTLETQFLMIAPYQTLDASKMIMYETPKWSTKDLGNGNFEINVKDLALQGKHDLIVVVRDECGNLSVPTRIPFTIEDCKGPAPICINGLSVDLMPNGNGGGMMTVWATDFIASKVYDCNGQGPEVKDGLKLVTKYSVNRVKEPVVPTQTSISVNCADLELGFILVELHAWDEAGNHDFCVTYVEVQDNRKVCPGSGVAKLSIAGKVATENSANLQGATITLSGQASMSATTTANGGYSFISLATGGDFTITPQFDKNHLNGVSTFDLVLIQKHILGIQALNSPYKMIAADVNNSKSITTLDLIALRKLILNIDQNFANNTSWRFVDAAYRFPDSNNPWSTGFPEVVSVNNLANNISASFVAIKIGDVNASAVVSSASSAEVRTSGTFNLNTTEQSLKAGNEYQVAFSAADLPNIQGYQFALNLDKHKVELVDIIYGVAKAENFGLFKDEGIITTSWNSKYEPGSLFTLVLRAKTDAKLSQALTLDRVVAPEAYNQSNDYLEIALNFGEVSTSEGYELLQNSPNPFTGETLIGFSLPKAASAKLIVRDVKGALLYQVTGNYPKGNSQVTLKMEQLNTSGVLYYTLETADFTATKKMVIIR